ncbi:hypothetical protein GC173_18875 [bacterium]|nr:hypothetical protein [bacterium]
MNHVAALVALVAVQCSTVFGEFAQIDEPGQPWGAPLYLPVSTVNPLITTVSGSAVRFHPGEQFITAFRATTGSLSYQTFTANSEGVGAAISPVVGIALPGTTTPYLSRTFGDGSRLYAGQSGGGVVAISLSQQGSVQATTVAPWTALGNTTPYRFVENQSGTRLHVVGNITAGAVATMDRTDPVNYSLVRSVPLDLSPSATVRDVVRVEGDAIVIAAGATTLLRVPVADEGTVPATETLALPVSGAASFRSMITNEEGTLLWVQDGTQLFEVATAADAPMEVLRTNLYPVATPTLLNWNSAGATLLASGGTSGGRTPCVTSYTPMTGRDLVPQAWNPAESAISTLRAAAVSTDGNLVVHLGDDGASAPLLVNFRRFPTDDGRLYVQELRSDQATRIGAAYAYVRGTSGTARVRVYKSSFSFEELWASDLVTVTAPGRIHFPIPNETNVTVTVELLVGLELTGDLTADFSSVRGDIGAAFAFPAALYPPGTAIPIEDALSTASAPQSLVAGVEVYTETIPADGPISLRTPNGSLLPNPIVTATDTLPTAVARLETGTGTAFEIDLADDFSNFLIYPLTRRNGTETDPFIQSVDGLPDGPGAIYVRLQGQDPSEAVAFPFFVDRVTPNAPAAPTLTALFNVQEYTYDLTASWPELAAADPAPSSGIDTIFYEYQIGDAVGTNEWTSQVLTRDSTSATATFPFTGKYAARMAIRDKAGNTGPYSAVATFDPTTEAQSFISNDIQPAGSPIFYLNGGSRPYSYTLLAGGGAAVDVAFSSDFSDAQRVDLFHDSDLSFTLTNFYLAPPDTLVDGPGTIYTRVLTTTGGFEHAREFPFFLDRVAPHQPTGIPTLVETQNGSGENILRITCPVDATIDDEPSSGRRNIVLEFYPPNYFGAATGETYLLTFDNPTIDLPSQLGNAVYARFRYQDNSFNNGPYSEFGYLAGDTTPPSYTFNLQSSAATEDPNYPAVGPELRFEAYGTGLIEFIEASHNPDMSDAVQIPATVTSVFITKTVTFATPFPVPGNQTVYIRPANQFAVGNIITLKYRYDDVPPVLDGELTVTRPATPTGRIEMRFPTGYDPQPGTPRISFWQLQVGTAPGEHDLSDFLTSTGGAPPSAVVIDNLTNDVPVYIRYRVADALFNFTEWANIGPYAYQPPPVVIVSAINPATPRTRDTLYPVYSFENPNESQIDIDYAWFVNGVQSPTTELFLPPSLTTKGQTWEFRARAADALGWGPYGSRSVVIQNTPPSEPFVEIRPRVPTVGQDLIVNVLTYSTDDDGDRIGYDFAWYQSKDGGETFIRKVELDGLPQVSNLYIDEGDIWEVVYTPFERDSKTGKSTKSILGVAARDRVYIGTNQLPVITATRPTLTDDGHLVGTFTATDPDNDLVRVVISWSDRLTSGIEELAVLSPGATSYDVTGSFPTDRNIYVHIAAYDAKGALKQIFTEPALKGTPAPHGWIME